jgi:hypothetical protein
LGAGHHAGVPVIGRCVGVHVDGPNGVSLASPHTQHSSDNPSFADHLFDHLIGAGERVAGSRRSNAFAVLRLIASSNLVDCTMGRSAGLVPQPEWAGSRLQFFRGSLALNIARVCEHADASSLWQ